MGSIALTLGNFDGVHLGHQALLHRLCKRARISVVVTFRQHPSSVLQGTPPLFLTHLPHRLDLLKQQGISQIELLDFTHELSLKSPEAFLLELKQRIAFNHLILGYDARFGYQRSGNREHLESLSRKMGFTLEYVDPLYVGEDVITSRAIREFVKRGDFTRASQFLGRPYSIIASPEKGDGRGRKLGFPTLNLPVDQLCLPPWGVYSVTVVLNGVSYSAIANLGIAPTFHTARKPLLEVHLIDYTEEITQPFEVIFHRFLRPEKQFASSEELIHQLHQDIQYLK